MNRAKSILALTLILCACAAADTLTPVSVTCTEEYNTGYPCSALIDGVTNDLTPGPGGVHSYWLGGEIFPDYVAVTNETFTVDLGYLDLVTGFDIFNTHNGSSDDRGTLAFTIWLSTTPLIPVTPS